MKKLFLTLVPLLLLGTGVFAQPSPDGKTTLFEIGTPVTTDAANFDNLFRNFSKYFENGNQIEFLTYKKVGTIKNRGQIKKYLKHNLSPATGFFFETMCSTAMNGNDYSSAIKIVVAPSDRMDIVAQWKNWADTTERSVHTGADVYEIEFNYAQQPHRYYIFVDPTTHRVVEEGNIFALKIPERHVAYIDAKE